MAKKGQSTKTRIMVACACDRCGQRSSAQAGTAHYSCLGMPPSFFDKAPSLKGRISNPEKKGTWIPTVKAEEQAA